MGSVGALGLLSSLRRNRFALGAAGALLLAAWPAWAAPPGHIRFQASNLVTTAEGEFHDWRISQSVVNEAEPAQSRIELEVSLASVDTGNGQRDDHLRTDDFFDVAKFPKAMVRLEGFELEGADSFTAQVTLDLHGHTKTFPMRFRIEDREARRITGAITLDRRDFGIGEPFSRWTPLSIHDEVKVSVDAIVPPASGAGAKP